MPSVIQAGTASNTALTLSSDTSGELQLKTNNGSTTALTLTTGGNINIPTTGARIVGNFSTGGTSSSQRVLFQTSTINDATLPGTIPNGTSTDSGFHIFNNADPNNSSFLELRANSTETTIRSRQFGTGTYLPFTIYTNNAERLRIDTSGNVGIGTSSPSVKLHVAGNGEILRINPSTNGYLSWYRGSTWAGYIDAESGGDMTFANATSSGNLKFLTNSAERMRIDSSGNVQIGTTGQSAKLAVNGVVYTMPTTIISSPVNGTWYTVGTATFNSVWQLTMKSVKAGNEQFSIYHVYIVVGGLVSLPQISNYTVGAGCGNAVRATNTFPSEGEIQVQINTTSVNSVSVTLTRLS